LRFRRKLVPDHDKEFYSNTSAVKGEKMDSYNHQPSSKYISAVIALRKLLEEEGENSVNQAFAETISETRKFEFGKGRGVLESSRGHTCIFALQGKKCPGGEKCSGSATIPASDHCSTWKRDGQVSHIISQPYYLGYEDLVRTMMFCEKYNLEVNINSSESWHFPGRTLNLEFTRKGEV
jgi:hypothetical protein